MRINELIKEDDNLEEGPLANKIGTAIGKGVGTVAKGVGAVAGGVAGIGSAVKKGYQAGKSTVASGGDDEADPAAAAAPAAGGTAAPTAAGGGTAAPAAGGAEPAAGGGGGLKGLWQNFKKGWAQGRGQAPADQTGAPAAGAEKPAAGGGAAAPAAGGTAAPAPAAGGTPAAAAAPEKTLANPKDPNAQAAGEKPAGGAAAPAAGGAEKPAAAPAAGGAVDQAKAGVDALKPQQQQQLAKELGAGAAAPAAGGAAAPAGAAPAAGGQNAAAGDTFEKAKADIRKVQSGTKPLPDNMVQGVQADIAKMAKGDKESGVFAAQKIMGFAQKGYDIAALQQSWNGNAKAAQRFLAQSVYRAIDKMLKENKLTWADLGLQITIFESVSGYVGVSYILSNKLQENVEKHKRKMFESSLSKGEFSIFRK